MSVFRRPPPRRFGRRLQLHEAANIVDSGSLSFDACFPDSAVGFIPARQVF